jgi:hypothetical protein
VSVSEQFSKLLPIHTVFTKLNCGPSQGANFIASCLFPALSARAQTTKCCSVRNTAKRMEKRQNAYTIKDLYLKHVKNTLK